MFHSGMTGIAETKNVSQSFLPHLGYILAMLLLLLISRMKKLLLLLLVGFLSAQPLQAGDELPTPVAILQTAGEMSQVETVHEELVIEVDQSLLPGVPPETSQSKSVYLRALEKLRDNVPAKVEKLFNKVNVPQELKEQIVNDLDYKLTRAPEIVENANGSGYSVRLVSMAGFGVTNYFRKVLSQKRWGKVLAKTPNFGMALGGGIAVVTFEREGRRKMVVRLFADFEHLDKVVNWMGEAIAGLSVGKISEKFSSVREEAERKVFWEKLTMQRSSLGPAANMMMQDNYYEHTANIAFGGGVGLSSFYDLKVHQFRLNFLFDVQRVINVKRALVKSCRWAIGKGKE